MGVQFQRYRSIDANGVTDLRAVKLTEDNLHAVAVTIRAHGWPAFVIGGANERNPRRITIRQRNFGNYWGKMDWRIAKVGDYIAKAPVHPLFVEVLGEFELWREKGSTFESQFKPLN